MTAMLGMMATGKDQMTLEEERCGKTTTTLILKFPENVSTRA
jgi:hypothetical protein